MLKLQDITVVSYLFIMTYRECYGAHMTLRTLMVSLFMPVLWDTAGVHTPPLPVLPVQETMTATTFMTTLMKMGSASVVEQVK